jgi:predicted nucleic acid-binding protein
MRLVLDTDVVVAAIRSPRGASAELLRRIDQGQAVMLLSVPLVLEYESICSRPEHQLVSVSEEINSHFRWRPQLRDPGDEMVLEVAINGQADCIVSFNLRDFGDRPSRFGINVLRPAEALRRLRT